jgi:hypothetical protein
MALRIGLAIRRRPAALFVLILAIAILLRLHGLARYPFDGDEVFSLEAAGGSWGHLFATAATDVSHPPLFYVLLKLWLAAGAASEFWARLLPVCFGIGLVPVARAICRRLRLPPGDTALVLVLTSVNVLLISYAGLLRMFSLLEFLTACSILAFLRLAGPLPAWRRMAEITGTNVLLVYSHYWGWMVVAVEAVLALAGNRARLRLTALSTAIVAAAFAPWALAVAAALGRRPAGAMLHIRWMGTGAPGVRDYVWLLGMFDGSIQLPHTTAVGIAVFLAPAVAAGWRQFAARRTAWLAADAPLFWAMLVFLPLALTSAASFWAHQNMFGYRHLSMLAVPYFVMIAVSLARLGAGWATGSLRAAMLGWAVVASAGAWFDTGQALRWDTLAARIAARGPVAIYAAEPFIALPLRFHLSRATGKAAAVAVKPDLAAIADREFWFVYRDTTWHGPDPKATAAHLHESVVEAVSIGVEAAGAGERAHSGAARQIVTALLLRRD